MLQQTFVYFTASFDCNKWQLVLRFSVLLSDLSVDVLYMKYTAFMILSTLQYAVPQQLSKPPKESWARYNFSNIFCGHTEPFSEAIHQENDFWYRQNQPDRNLKFCTLATCKWTLVHLKSCFCTLVASMVRSEKTSETKRYSFYLVGKCNIAASIMKLAIRFYKAHISCVLTAQGDFRSQRKSLRSGFVSLSIWRNDLSATGSFII